MNAKALALILLTVALFSLVRAGDDEGRDDRPERPSGEGPHGGSDQMGDEHGGDENAMGDDGYYYDFE